MINNKIIFFLLAIFLFASLKISAQEDDAIRSLEDIIEEIVSSASENLGAGEDDGDVADFSVLYENLENYYHDPLNLNIATEEELKDFVFLTKFQMYSIVNYRKKYGNYNSIYELQFVDGIDEQTLKWLLPFVTVREAAAPKTDWKKVFSYGKHNILMRYQRTLQEQKGYTDKMSENSRYLGNPDKYLLKYNYSYKNKISYGLTAEKDQGEQFFKGAQKYGFDFYSAHFQINDIGFMKKLIVGDFSTQFGQGLTLWSGQAFGKTSNPLNIIKKPRGVNKYTSVNESKFFRGQAATFEFWKFRFTEFVSYKKLDGTVEMHANDSIDDAEAIIAAFDEGGYHRTRNEIAKRKTIDEFVTGGNLTFSAERFKIGLTGVYNRYSASFEGRKNPYQLHNFTGKSNFNMGVDYLVTLNRLNIFGETSMSQNFGLATLNGAIIDFVPEFKMSVLHRYYSSDYQAIYAVPFSEGGKAFNENGIYVGIQLLPIKKWRIDVGVDAFKFPWLKYGIYSPSSGFDFLGQINFSARRDLDMYVKVRHKLKQKTLSVSDISGRPLYDYAKTTIRYHLNFTATDEWKLKSRVEVSRFHKLDSANWGFMIFQAIQYKPKRIPLTFTLHLAVFDCIYDNRFYVYEPNVLYDFAVPAYSGKGQRTVFVIKYAIINNIDLWFRIANTYYSDRQKIGSGATEINGNNTTEVRVQLRIKF